MKSYQPHAGLLKDHIILITGAGSGIGRTIAITYAKYGATTLLLGRTPGKLEAVKNEIHQQGYPAPHLLPMDLESTHYADYEALADQIDNHFGRLDGLVHNAGLLGRVGSVCQYEPDLWSKVFQVNVHAEFMLTKACLPLLRKNRDSALLFTTSSVGIQGRANWGAYCVSKFATEGFAQVVADEEKNIRVNVINPGAVRTHMRATACPAEDPMTLPTPEDIMPAYLYFMGKDSRGITGQRVNAQE